MSRRGLEVSEPVDQTIDRGSPWSCAAQLEYALAIYLVYGLMGGHERILGMQ